MKIGQKVKILKAKWECDCGVWSKVDVFGRVSSVKGVTEGHNNIHDYELTHDGGKVYVNAIESGQKFIVIP